MKVNGFQLFLILLLVSIALTSVYEPLRYLKYVLPIIPIVLFSTTKRTAFNKDIANYYFTFAGFYFVVVTFLLVQDIITLDLSPRFVPNVVFIFGPLLFCAFAAPYFKPEKAHRYVMTIFLISIGVFIYEDLFDLMSIIFDINILRTALFSSMVVTESHLGYSFGFFVLYFFMEKYPKRYKIAALIMLVICFKRIALLATIVTLVIYFALRLTRLNLTKNRVTWTVVGLVANCLYILVTQAIVAGSFDEWVQTNTGFSTDRFLMGRQQFYTEAFDKIGNISWTGVGIGKVDDIMISFYGADSGLSMRLHSEILKNYFEFGAVLFVAWIAILYYKNLFSNKAAVFLIYFNILCLTDNAFIYFDVMFYFYFFVLIFLTQRLQQQQSTIDLPHELRYS